MLNKIKKSAAELRREYIKEWRRKNPDKVKLYNQTYWERKAELEREKADESSESK